MKYPMSTYISCYINAFDLEDSAGVELLEFEGIAEWDSIGHMSLISELEDSFNISIKLDHVIAWSSFQVGVKILSESYQIEIS